MYKSSNMGRIAKMICTGGENQVWRGRTLGGPATRLLLLQRKTLQTAVRILCRLPSLPLSMWSGRYLFSQWMYEVMLRKIQFPYCLETHFISLKLSFLMNCNRWWKWDTANTRDMHQKTIHFLVRSGWSTTPPFLLRGKCSFRIIENNVLINPTRNY